MKTVYGVVDVGIGVVCLLMRVWCVLVAFFPNKFYYGGHDTMWCARCVLWRCSGVDAMVLLSSFLFLDVGDYVVGRGVCCVCVCLHVLPVIMCARSVAFGGVWRSITRGSIDGVFAVYVCKPLCVRGILC